VSYNYQRQREELFTENGFRILLTIRDNVKRLLDCSGSFKASHALKDVTGDSWVMLAALDYLVEINEIVRVTGQSETWGLSQIFTSPNQ
jgi:hypothetical protein